MASACPMPRVPGMNSLQQKLKERTSILTLIGRRSRQGRKEPARSRNRSEFANLLVSQRSYFNKRYAQAHSPDYATTPRKFLLSLMSIAPLHALLITHWGSEGAAAISLPTKEYSSRVRAGCRILLIQFIRRPPSSRILLSFNRFCSAFTVQRSSSSL
ncbi:hypothetical protein BDP27DRAFT_1331528 [Rhodocollybia butyracea]|uniref:Uncharacterized protein n=1 Tax=Rhodocollybia butyracea TaxID=206335 RepID=A0A9P5PPH0_9AGAR|nr:hypothetical protein BDP27DRAFT_1331528 [Rhodocollybia butyracea]